MAVAGGRQLRTVTPGGEVDEIAEHIHPNRALAPPQPTFLTRAGAG
jgi:hypothetical protein